MWRRVWRGTGMLVLLVPAATTVLLAGAGAASAATLNVCQSGCPYTQIAPAVAAARSGDTIRVGPGTYRGGITIDVSVRLAGSGPGSTIIRGGGHVLTIGAFGGSSEPVVSISGVMITGGVARSSPESKPLVGETGVWAAGGGVEIPPQAIPANSLPVDGATVRISNSVITGNRADPARAVPSGITCPGGFPAGQCPFAQAAGGGIDSWGHLTLVNTAVSGNTVGRAAGLPAVPSDADGAGIYSAQGSLTMTNIVMSGNQATAAVPNGRFAEGGAVFAGFPFAPVSDALTVRDSVVNRNRVNLTTNLPKFAAGQLIQLGANSGGIHVGDRVPTTVENTAITGNSVMSKSLRGEAGGIDVAMNVGDSPLTMRNSIISGNKLFSTVATTAGPGAAGNALELDGGGVITNTRITGNTTTIVSPDGVAGNAGAGLVMLNFNHDARLVTVRGGVISGNTAIAKTLRGSATSQGAGILNDSLLELRGVRVSGNAGKAIGPSGVAQGGGIWNGTDISGPPVQLALDHTIVIRNSLTGSHGITVQGGGLFTELPVTLRHSLIALNRPDQCVGCASPVSSPGNSKIAGQRRNPEASPDLRLGG